jgi:steroid delta-isomerase-like uncharacterized protein
MPSSQSTHELLCRVMVEKVFNEGQLDLLPLLMAPDALTHELEAFGAATASGPEGFRNFLRAFRFAFPDLRVTVLDQVSGGDRVVTRWRMEGTQTRHLMGIAASRRTIRCEGIRIDRIVNGRIAETWNQWDALGMLQQLGALPPLDRAPRAAESARPASAADSARPARAADSAAA